MVEMRINKYSLFKALKLNSIDGCRGSIRIQVPMRSMIHCGELFRASLWSNHNVKKLARRTPFNTFDLLQGSSGLLLSSHFSR